MVKPMSAEEIDSVPPVEHPLVRTDAVTGRKSLFISPGYVRSIDGMGDDAAQALIKDLCEWAIQPEFVFTHRWQRHDVLMWDNRPTMHARTAFDFGHQRRIMHRTTLVGDAPVV